MAVFYLFLTSLTSFFRRFFRADFLMVVIPVGNFPDGSGLPGRINELLHDSAMEMISSRRLALRTP
jgi:hypothetical protein